MTNLRSLPINFVHPSAQKWNEYLISRTNGNSLDIPANAFKDASDAYIVRTFFEIKRAGGVAVLSEITKDDCINVVYTAHNRLSSISAASFIIAVQADCYRPYACDMRVVGNRAQASSHDYVIPPWPQHGLICRDSSRGTRVETVGFLGFTYNLDPTIRCSTFSQRLQSLGCRLVVKGPDEWHDFHDVDIVLALRPRTNPLLHLKPPTKLVNSWKAGCPAVLGIEPGFRELRKSPIDYLEVADAEGAFNAIANLQRDHQLYEDCVRNCMVRAIDFQEEKILAEWERILVGAEARRILLSNSRSGFAVRYLLRLTTACAEKMSRARFSQIVRRQ